jgi:glycosyltransferase involved in cell wall biosynthesis
MNDADLLINLSFLASKPTGLTNYATNLFPYLKNLNPTLLIANPVDNFTCYPVPSDLTQSQGSKGNVKRILWTQFELPRIYQKLKSSLLFSPVPEAPIYQKCRFIVTVHDLIPLRFPRRFSLLTLYCRHYLPKVLEEAQHIICDCVATADDIQHFLGISANKITPVLLAYDVNHFRPIVDISLSPEIPYFLYIGRADPHKNLHRLISSFAAIRNCRDYQLWIVGGSDPRFTPLLKAQVGELGLSGQVKFLEYLPYTDLPRILSQAMALVLPSLWEGFGLPVLEAMGCGVPVITSNISSLPEVAGDAAILINPYNSQEITDAMERIAQEPQLRSRLSQLGLQRASQFSWEKTGQQTIEVLKQYL